MDLARIDHSANSAIQAPAASLEKMQTPSRISSFCKRMRAKNTQKIIRKRDSLYQYLLIFYHTFYKKDSTFSKKIDKTGNLSFFLKAKNREIIFKPHCLVARKEKSRQSRKKNIPKIYNLTFLSIQNSFTLVEAVTLHDRLPMFA